IGQLAVAGYRNPADRHVRLSRALCRPVRRQRRTGSGRDAAWQFRRRGRRWPPGVRRRAGVDLRRAGRRERVRLRDVEGGPGPGSVPGAGLHGQAGHDRRGHTHRSLGAVHRDCAVQRGGREPGGPGHRVAQRRGHRHRARRRVADGDDVGGPGRGAGDRAAIGRAADRAGAGVDAGGAEPAGGDRGSPRARHRGPAEVPAGAERGCAGRFARRIAAGTWGRRHRGSGPRNDRRGGLPGGILWNRRVAAAPPGHHVRAGHVADQGRPFDALLAGAPATVGTIGTIGTDRLTTVDRPVDALAIGLVLVSAAVVTLRRRWPLPVLAAVTAAITTFLTLGYPYGPIFLIFVVAVFT